MKAVERRRRALPDGNRRAFVARLTAAAIWGILPTVRRADAAQPLRFGTTPVFLNEQVALLARWQRHLAGRLGRPVQFVQRGSYREVVDLLLTDAIEAAWLCGHPLVLYEDRLSAIAVPSYQGEPLYRSYLIAPERDRSTRTVADLRGRVLAYSDPLSNSGYLVPRAELVRIGIRPEGFFRRTFFTFSHRKVIEAVRAGLADGGAVDGYVWDTLAKQQPESVVGVRVVWRSAPHGFPPVVARRNGSAREARALALALKDMTQTEEGRGVLAQLNLDGFADPVPGQFDSIRALLRVAEPARP